MAKVAGKTGKRSRTKAPARGKRSPARRSSVRKAAAKPSRKHKFVVSHLRDGDFKSDGLRAYAQYRDLGVKAATNGMAVAHVIRFVGECDPQVVSKEHTHEADFQMIYVLKGSMTSQFEDLGRGGLFRRAAQSRARAGCAGGGDAG